MATAAAAASDAVAEANDTKSVGALPLPLAAGAKRDRSGDVKGDAESGEINAKRRRVTGGKTVPKPHPSTGLKVPRLSNELAEIKAQLLDVCAKEKEIEKAQEKETAACAKHVWVVSQIVNTTGDKKPGFLKLMPKLGAPASQAKGYLREFAYDKMQVFRTNTEALVHALCCTLLILRREARHLCDRRDPLQGGGTEKLKAKSSAAECIVRVLRLLWDSQIDKSEAVSVLMVASKKSLQQQADCLNWQGDDRQPFVMVQPAAFSGNEEDDDDDDEGGKNEDEN